MKKLLAILMVFSGYAMGAETASLPLPTTGNVTLTLAEYNRLVELASKSSKQRETPPLPYAIKRVDMKLHVTNETVLGTLQLDGEVFSKGAANVPLTTGLTILNARQEGKSLPLEEEGSTSMAILPGGAEFSVALETGMPLAIEAGRASFNLPVPAAGSVRLQLVIPGDHSIVRISPGLITSRTTEKGQTTLEATLVPGQPATVWWVTGIVQVPVVKHEVRFLSDVKTLVTVNDEELRIAALADITVIQGDPTQFVAEIPEGYEITGVSGATVDSSEVEKGKLMVRLNASAPRSHEFLISMERPLSGTKADAPFISFKDTQRETGEVLVEGTGAMELTATEGCGLKRIDLKEVNPYLRSLARFPLQAAFRFHRQPTETPKLALEWTRFPDSTVLAAVAEHAMVTTLVTVEGKALTEVKLTVKNQAQPFLKVNLPAGACIVSAYVAGDKIKLVQGSDGSRVPLLRPGFRPTGPYIVSFVLLHSGAPFAKKGGSDLALPKMNVPIDLLQWEVFLPERYKVKDFGGDALATSLLPPTVWSDDDLEGNEESGNGLYAPRVVARDFRMAPMGPGQVGGIVVDPSGAVIPNVKVTVYHQDTGTTLTATTDNSGRWVVSNVPSGRVRVTAASLGFKDYRQETNYDASRPLPLSFSLGLGTVTETVTVTAGVSDLQTSAAQVEKQARKRAQEEERAASSNVTNLQRRVAGVLPVAVDVPRTGNSYRF